MNPQEPPPLWLESIPDREPWRRGRIAICVITLLILLALTNFLLWSVVLGSLTMFLLAVSLGVVGCLFLYFIWIGHTWARWVLAPLYGGSGFINLIAGIVQGNGLLFVVGIGGLVLSSYLALAPSVYAFAHHQRERIKRWESLAVAGILLIVLVSIGSGVYVVYAYVISVEREAMSFSMNAFQNVFVDRDEEYLRNNLSDEEHLMTPHDFIRDLTNTLGKPLKVGRPEARFTTKIVARRLWVDGKIWIPFDDSRGMVWANMEVSRIGEGWQIDHIGWTYNSP